MSQFDFNTIIPRQNTNSLKWDYTEKMLGGKDLLPLWVADMDFASPPCVTEALQRKISHGIYGYNFTPPAFFSSFIQWQKTRKNIDIKENEIIPITGAVTALSLLLQHSFEVGDEIICFTPVYPPFLSAIKENNRELKICPLKRDNDGKYFFDFENFEKIITHKTKAIILCNPHNPVGRCFTQEELEQLGIIAQRHNLVVISDEVHSDLVYSKHQFRSFLQVKSFDHQNSYVIMGPGKTFNLSGLATAMLICPNPKYKDFFQKILYRHALYGPKSFGIAASIAAYDQGGHWLDELLLYLEHNIDLIQKELSPQISFRAPEATYLAWLNFSSLGLSEKELNEVIKEKAKLGLNPGFTFGVGGEQHMRLNFACPRPILEDAIQRLNKIF